MNATRTGASSISTAPSSIAWEALLGERGGDPSLLIDTDAQGQGGEFGS